MVKMNEKAKILIDLAYSQIGSPYVFGAWGSLCTPDLRKKYAKYNPEYKDTIYKACQVLTGKSKTCEGCKYDGKLAFDCRGFTHWCLEHADIIDIYGGGATTQYNTKSNWDYRGEIQDMPNLPCIIFQKKNDKMVHTGVYIGDKKVIHAQVGVQLSNLTTAWTHYAIPKNLYTEEEIKAAGGIILMTTLKFGSRNSSVKELQKYLKKFGYYNGEIDGAFGKKTEEAVKAFQEVYGLKVDGIVGEQTWAKLKELDEEGTTQSIEDRLAILEEKVAKIEEKLR